MQRFAFAHWSALRLMIGALAVVAIALTWSAPRRELPFHLKTDAAGGVIEARGWTPLPAGLQAGDRVVLAEQTARMRAVLADENVPGSRTYRLWVQRAGSVLPVAVRSVAQKQTAESGRIHWVSSAEQAMLLVLGLLTLWRGRDWAAWGLAMFAISILFAKILVGLPAPPFPGLALHMVAQWLGGPMAFLGLYLTATALVGLRPRWLHGLGIVYLLLLLLLFVLEAGGSVAFVAFAVSGESAAFNDIIIACGIAGLAVPLWVLLRGYVDAAAAARLRIRWILSSTGLLLPAMLIEIALQNAAVQQSPALMWLRWIGTALTIAVLALYTYAVLRQRLVEVRVVVNRALVFALLMGVVVGLFALMESLIERSAIGERAGLALEIGVPLALGILFHQLHRRVEALVDRVFFHREHRAREALSDFVRDAGFVESPQTLIARTVEAFSRDAGVTGAALYEAREGGFDCSGRDGAGFACPDRLDQDDRALVRLRATLAPLDLHGVGSALGAEGLALPLALRGHLFGVLVCGPRPAGRHAQADIERLGHAAHEVGASLFALRARANESLVEALARGVLPPAQAVLQARALAAAPLATQAGQ
ncbi:MAG: hypothetical protein ACYCZI_01475 [Metallibacterium scheffleri]|jgi:hypothetical protein